MVSELRIRIVVSWKAKFSGADPDLPLSKVFYAEQHWIQFWIPVLHWINMKLQGMSSGLKLFLLPFLICYKTDPSFIGTAATLSNTVVLELLQRCQMP